jgi:hypothetical protein
MGHNNDHFNFVKADTLLLVHHFIREETENLGRQKAAFAPAAIAALVSDPGGLTVIRGSELLFLFDPISDPVFQYSLRSAGSTSRRHYSIIPCG